MPLGPLAIEGDQIVNVEKAPGPKRFEDSIAGYRYGMSLVLNIR